MAAGPAYPEGDPRNAEYFETLAKLHQQYEGTIGEIGGPTGETGLRKTARENAKYSEGQIAKQEPGGFRNLRNRAGKEGLTHSGILGGRTGSLAAQYGARRFTVTHGLQERENEYTRKEQRAAEKLKGGEAGAAKEALERRKEFLLNNPGAAAEEAMMPGGKPASNAASTAPAGGAAAAAAPRRVSGYYTAGPGTSRTYHPGNLAGVNPGGQKIETGPGGSYRERGPGFSVRVGTGVRGRPVRRLAAKKMFASTGRAR